MAEAVGVIASALTIGAGAAQLSLALFSVAQTLKNAPVEIAEIAQEIQSLAESLQMLADIIGGHKNLCKPELFERTRSIISRYNEVDAELRKLIDSPHKLARLKWCIKKPKAKSLLKKVEGIKVALVLELNIVRLAREEVIRPYSDANFSRYSDANFSVQVRNTPKANRFRRIVESAVRANRQVVEDARRDEIKNDTEKHPHVAAELDLWKADSFDTATWLYHLVFSPESPDPPARRRYQASVENADNPNPLSEASLSSMATGSNISTNVNGKEMIVWSRQTEPNQVVDRLLYAWTTLSPDQISLSATRESGDEWRDDVMSMIEEAKPDDTSSFQDWETIAEGDKDAAEVRQEAHDRVLDRKRRRPLPKVHESGPPLNPPLRRSRRRSTTTMEQLDKAWSTQADDGKKAPRVRYMDSEESTTTYDEKPRRENTHDSDSRNPFKPGYRQPSVDEYVTPWEQPIHLRIPVHVPNLPYHPPVPPPYGSYWPPPHDYDFMHPQAPLPIAVPPPPPPAQKAGEPPEPLQEPPTGFDTAEKEDCILSKLEKLIYHQENEKENNAVATDAQFARLEQLLTSNAEAEARRENAIIEEQLTQMQHARKHDEQKLEQLEKQAQEARELVEKKVAAAQAAKEAAEASLRFAQSEADKRAREEAAIKVAEEKKKIEDANKQQIEHYEELLRVVKEQRSESDQNNQGTVRRTRISEGNRSIDVTEYTADKRGSSSLMPIPSFGHLQTSQFRSDRYMDRQGDYARSRPGRRESFHSSVTSMRSSRRSPTPTNSSTTSNKSQQLIVFPAKANRDSPAISTLQRSLAEFGVDCVFQDLESSSYDQLIPYSYAESNEEQIVHSTILWESPMLSLGSELLFSLRKAGWKPTYTRTSRKGQTHFLGSQPLHTYFFQADYKPQFTTSTITPSDESIAIHSALVEKYALIELGFLFKLNETGFYILDGRLSY
ncbi:TolA, Membrane protein colicin uptake [Pyrenophora tritici-repentis]|nr:DUF3602 domain containing protein [Pyrenophora tritici-repentis]PZC95209.1 TolA, Membrane protein colicin uptake [Pyrenophora tritici-repentis]PZD30169.1 TolA, Membrane protein colicin uptake [Pyrenophora tritici-repentis]